MGAAEQEKWAALFTVDPQSLSATERQDWLDDLHGVAVCSDAFFPFRDNIDRAVRSGAQYIIEPGGSRRDEEVIAAANEAGITLIFSGLRLFTH
jgi:phosphoribosylaminoimidazolecarboxamide formyltransferase/IMP cyclohydrolase